MAVSKEIEQEPLVSVIIPCYNHGKFLGDALNSVIKQTYTHWECIIINDGSTDHTEEISLKWVKKDERIKYYSKANGGLSSARNFGLNRSSGKYIQFLDADDTITPGKFENGIGLLNSDRENNTIVVSDFLMLDAGSGDKLPAYCDLSKTEFSFNSILTGWDDKFTIPIHCAIFPANYFQKIKFDETLRAKEDWVMWLTVIKAYNPRVIFENKPFAVYRCSLQSMSKHTVSMYENTARAFEIIFQKLLSENEATVFFKKINDFWRKEALLQAAEIEKMNNAKYFRVRKKILGFFSTIGIPLKS